MGGKYYGLFEVSLIFKKDSNMNKGWPISIFNSFLASPAPGSQVVTSGKERLLPL